MIVATRLLPPVFLRKIPPCFPFLYKFISSSTSMMGRIIYWDILSTKPQVPWIFDTSFEMFILFHIEKFSLCSLDNWKRSHTMSMCLCLPAGMPEPLHRWPVRCCRPKPQRRTRWTAKKKNADEANMGFHQGKVLIFVAPNQSVWSKDSKKNIDKKTAENWNDTVDGQNPAPPGMVKTH